MLKELVTQNLKHVTSVPIKIMFNNPKKRCSIMWCPWKGKYQFDIEGYWECWFHGNEDKWYGILWNGFTHPIRFLYGWVRYRI